MSPIENGNNPAHFGAVAALDRRIDNIDREFGTRIDNLGTRLDSSVTSIRNEVAGRIDRLSVEQREQTNELSNKIERSQRSTNPYQLILVMIAICGVAGAAAAYVAKNLSDNIVTVNDTLGKTIAAVDETLAKDLALNKKAVENEEKERVESDRRIYEVIGKTAAAAWSRGEQVEFERREDEEKVLERDYVRERLTRVELDLDLASSKIVSREDEQQYRTQVTRDLDAQTKSSGDSINRLLSDLNEFKTRTGLQFSEQDKALHGYGLTDEVKQARETQREFGAQLLQLYQLLAGGRIGGATLNTPSPPKPPVPPAD